MRAMLLGGFLASAFFVTSATPQDTRNAELAGANKALNSTYQDVLRRLKPGDQAALRAAQRAWITFRDADCAFGDGDHRECMIQRTDERERQLRDTGYFDAQGKPFLLPSSALVDAVDRAVDGYRVPIRSASNDLDGDGLTEEVVYLTDRSYCGSGGCNALVLKRTGQTFRVVMKATVTWPPIRVLPTRTNGWRDLGVTVHGGGITRAYEARLRFDGQRYPSNPTVPPAEPMVGVSGDILIDEKDR